MSQDIKGWKDIPYTVEAQAKLNSLTSTQGVLAVRMKVVNGGKVQVEFAQKIDNGRTVVNALSMLNASDERFSNQGGPARTWLSVEPTDLKKMFGFELTEGESHKELLSILPNVEGNVFGLQIIETAESNLPKRLQGEYLESNLKRAGKNGDFFYLPNGERVGRYVNLVAAPVGQVIEHTLIKDATIGVQESVTQATGPILTKI